MNCPICNNTNIRDFGGLRLYRCIICFHIFKGVPVGRGFYKNYVSSAHGKATPNHVVNAKRAANDRFILLNAFAKQGSVLEVGCGHKYFLDKLVENGYTAHGTELSMIMASEIKHKMYLGNPTDIKNLPKYDNICAFHVIEHLNDPVKEIKCLVDHMDNDGAFVFELPTMLFYGLNLQPRRFYEGLHTQYFSQKSLYVMLEKCGLELVMQTNYWVGDKICNTMGCAVKKTSDLEKAREKAFKYLRR